MGFKRPFDDVEFQELPYKHSRQHEFGDRRSPFSDAVSCNGAPRKTCVSGENRNGDCKSQWRDVLEKYSVAEVSTSVNKGCASFSLVTRSCGEEDVRSGPDACSTPTEDFKFDFPRRTFVPFKDAYSSLFDCSPRKQVPVGPDHQAIIPTWSGHMNLSDQKVEINNDSEEKLLGTCVIPMPVSDLSALECDKVGLGRTDCSCLDAGSVRCVRQHVMEAREELRRTLGNEKFVKLGFCDMGEEVAQRWSEEEEQTFLEVVYSNPASLGRKFWKQLSAVFPSRSKRELISYYFNVFMLRTRGAQNRSSILDIDSDDDEWHVNDGGSNDGRIAEDDEDSVIESPYYQDDHLDHEEDYSEEDSSDDDGGDGDGDVGHVGGDSSEEDGGIDHVAQSYMLNSVNEGKFDTVGDWEKNSACTGEEFDFQDDSCVSFEFQSYTHDSHSKCLDSQPDASGDVAGHAYLLEPCNAKVWDARFTVDTMKGDDLLPTWSMIEDIFDQGMEDYRMTDERKAPTGG
ncbi:uncharacterized protein LOC125477736 [Pyrus x bretschneideri]|uniref:uncharacterized protein LOC125477736 n=1 Tax=Pyrus x bretschneideri TaxID=225117 RepID=UPI00202FFB66|nr:uncharacterized protein LOC125477736 [Pyrus x bretschneideri]